MCIKIRFRYKKYPDLFKVATLCLYIEHYLQQGVNKYCKSSSTETHLTVLAHNKQAIGTTWEM